MDISFQSIHIINILPARQRSNKRAVLNPAAGDPFYVHFSSSLKTSLHLSANYQGPDELNQVSEKAQFSTASPQCFGREPLLMSIL